MDWRLFQKNQSALCNDMMVTEKNPAAAISCSVCGIQIDALLPVVLCNSVFYFMTQVGFPEVALKSLQGSKMLKKIIERNLIENKSCISLVLFCLFLRYSSLGCVFVSILSSLGWFDLD